MTSYEIDVKERFRDFVRGLPETRRQQIGQTLNVLRDAFGRPHVHTGLGIRRLRRNFFECRAGRDVRLIFEVLPGKLLFHAAGSHDEVQRFLKNI